MSFSFADMKKNNDKLNEKLFESVKNDSQSRTDRKVDERMWYPGADKAGNGTAVIRFLPAAPGDEHAFVKLYRHAFKNENTGRWYIENSLSTKGQLDPCGVYNSKLWATGLEENKNIARKQGRKTEYFFNVLVIKDSENPENEGQVKILKAGPWLWNFVKAKMFPEFDDQQPVNVFDFWQGANFRIRIGKKGEHRNYDRSEWDSPAALFDGDDAKIEAVWNQQHSLKEFVADSEFKTYEELEKKLNEVLGINTSAPIQDIPAREEKMEAPANKRQIPETVETNLVMNSDDDDDEEEDFFAKLAMED